MERDQSRFQGVKASNININIKIANAFDTREGGLFGGPLFVWAIFYFVCMFLTLC